MRQPFAVILFATVVCGLLLPSAAGAQITDRDGDVRTFAILPGASGPDPNNAGNILAIGHPEGLTADADGNVYAATFETNFDSNFIYVWDPAGRLTVTVPVPSGRAPLGMVTTCHNPSRRCPAGPQYLFVNDVLNGDIMRYQLPLTPTSQPAIYDVCGGFLAAFGIGAPAEKFCALNANDIGPDGRLYISDNGAGPSFVFSDKFRNGRIWVFDPRTGASGVWFDRDTRRELDVQIGGFPEFGVNGVAFGLEGRSLYLANMSSDVIYRMLLSDCDKGACQPGFLNVFTRGQGINGPDNIDFDANGILWVASGQNDRVVAINRSGQVIAKIGRFEGMSRSGAPEGLMQPSGLIVSGDRVYVGNEASRGLRPNPDLIPETTWNELRLFTISEIRSWIIQFRGTN
jgi:sugar lactone lactonase YvrE